MAKRAIRWLVAASLCGFLHLPASAATQVPAAETAGEEIVPFEIRLHLPKVVLADIPFAFSAEAVDEHGNRLTAFNAPARIEGFTPANPADTLAFQEGILQISQALIAQTGVAEIGVAAAGKIGLAQVRSIPGIFSILPPLLAILLAFVFRQVLLSLFLGIFLGAFFIYDYSPIRAFFRTVDTYLINALADPDHAAIIIFSMTLGGMVGIISRSGGMMGIVESIRKYANHPRGGQLATWLMGILIFFDDYANTLLVGNTMRPFTDRLRISREKLSYIVDSTAAPVASVALISTWIGYQIGLIDQALKNVGIEKDAYFEFLQSIPYTYYSLLAIVFVALIGYFLRDFGPMLRAEKRTAATGKVLRDGAQPLMDTSGLDVAAEDNIPFRWYNGLIPIAGVILVTIFGLYYSGVEALGPQASQKGLRDIISAANSFSVLMWASFTGVFLAMLLVLSQRILSLSKTIDALLGGYRSMILAAIILNLAWAIGAICGDLHTANYVIEMTRDYLSVHYIPTISFVVSAFIAFSTGTSWATMAIFIPIAVPMAYTLPAAQGLPATVVDNIILSTIGAVLAGSVFGDHCSPISDTTIMSSMASGADHIDHVRTQMPYALVVAAVAIGFGYLPAGFGFNPFLLLFIASAVLVLIVRFIGKPVEGR